MSKQSHRSEILSQIEAKQGMIDVLRREAQSLVQSLTEEWVVRRTVLVQRSWNGGTGAPAGSETFHGCLYPGTPHYQEGFLFKDHQHEGVRVFRTPSSAKLYAQCAVDKDRGFDRQSWYKIEVVDRRDGEIFCEIPCRSEYVKAIDRGASLTEAAKLL